MRIVLDFVLACLAFNYARKFYRVKRDLDIASQYIAARNNPNQRNTMANDAASEVKGLVDDDNALYQSTVDLTAALKAAQAANPSSDFVTPDIQKALDDASAAIAARQASAPAPTPAPAS